MRIEPVNRRERISRNGFKCKQPKLVKLGELAEMRSIDSPEAQAEQERKRIQTRAERTGSEKLAALADEHRSIRYGETIEHDPSAFSS